MCFWHCTRRVRLTLQHRMYDEDTHCFTCVQRRFGKDDNAHVAATSAEKAQRRVGHPIGRNCSRLFTADRVPRDRLLSPLSLSAVAVSGGGSAPHGGYRVARHRGIAYTARGADCVLFHA